MYTETLLLTEALIILDFQCFPGSKVQYVHLVMES